MATYKTAATFEMDEADFKSYRSEILKGIKTERMALMANGRILIWIDEELAKFKTKEKKEEKV